MQALSLGFDEDDEDDNDYIDYDTSTYVDEDEVAAEAQSCHEDEWHSLVVARLLRLLFDLSGREPLLKQNAGDNTWR